MRQLARTVTLQTPLSRRGGRRKMMKAWADYLDGLKAGAEVIPLFKKGITNPFR